MKRVDQVLPSAIDRGVLNLVRAQSVLQRWDEIVGPGLAERSWPDRYDRGIVWVAVKGSAWAQELRLMKELILKRLQELSDQPGVFNDVRFGVRKLPVREGLVPPDEAEPAGELSIREIAQRRLNKWKD